MLPKLLFLIGQIALAVGAITVTACLKDWYETGIMPFSLGLALFLLAHAASSLLHPEPPPPPQMARWERKVGSLGLAITCFLCVFIFIFI
jgi:cytochrome b561